MNNRVDDMKDELEKLSKEFDCLGLPTINVNVDVLDQLVTSVSRLVQLYRKSLTKLQDVGVERSIFQEDCRSRKNKIEELKDKIKDCETVIKNKDNNLLKYQFDIDSLKLKLQERDNDLQCAKLYTKNKETELEHKINRLQHEIDKLNGENKLAKYVSQDEFLADKIHKYKVKEEIYQDTILKLQENNDKLLGEVLNLKEEVLVALSQHKDAT